MIRSGFYYILKEFNGLLGMFGDLEILVKCVRREMYCLIYCSDDDGVLVSLIFVELWRILRWVVELRYYEDIFGIWVNLLDEIFEVYYYRKCRSIFIMIRDFEKIIFDEKKESKKDMEMIVDGDS